MKSFLLPAAPNDRARTFYGKAVVVKEKKKTAVAYFYPTACRYAGSRPMGNLLEFGPAIVLLQCGM